MGIPLSLQSYLGPSPAFVLSQPVSPPLCFHPCPCGSSTCLSCPDMCHFCVSSLTLVTSCVLSCVLDFVCQMIPGVMCSVCLSLCLSCSLVLVDVWCFAIWSLVPGALFCPVFGSVHLCGTSVYLSCYPLGL